MPLGETYHYTMFENPTASENKKIIEERERIDHDATDGLNVSVN